MELMMHQNSHGRGPVMQACEYDQDTAHTVEVQREVKDSGELGSFGFTLQDERPPKVGTIVPGGPADRAGLKKQEFVIAVNGQSTLNCSHHEVVSIIFNTKTPGVWLTVCDGPQSSSQGQPPLHALPSGNRLGFTRVHSLGSFSMSQSTPVIPRNMTDSPRYSSAEDSPPKYQDLQKYGHHGGGGSSNHVLRHKDQQGAPVPNSRVSPLTKNLAQHNGYSSSSSGLHHRPTLQNAKHLATFGMSEQSVFSQSQTTPATTAFTSASVLVLYIGPVEIPESWSSRELSSKCLQECTRRLLSQRQEFVEAFLEVTLSNMKILSVSQNVIFKHKRDELYYSGVCSNDEQTFGIVTRKMDGQKGGKKSVSGSNIAKPIRAHMCHVFKVMQHKSVLMLHSGGDGKDSSKSGKSKAIMSQHKPQKTIPIKSCVTIINAIQGIFTGTAIPGKSFDETFAPLSLKPTLTTYSSGSSNESMYANGNPDKQKKKKLDVVDLRPSAYISPPVGSMLAATPPSANQNMYVSHPTHPVTTATITSSASSASPLVNHHVRSQSNPASDYMGTPAYHQRSSVGMSGGNLGGGGTFGGSGGGGIGGGTSWYANDSPKEEYHPRTRSWGNKSPVGYGGGGGGGRSHDQHHDGAGGNRRILSNKNAGNPQHDRMKRFSDDSSLSSLSDSRASSPAKQSSYASYSRSPSPNRSLSYSSRSRTPSPPPTNNRWAAAGGPVVRPPRMGASAARRLRSGMALEVGSIRSGAISPNSMARSFRGSRANLRRQGSESSILDLQDLPSSSGMTTQAFGAGLPPKNGPLSSSIGSVATITTIADKTAEDPDECGRVGGWVASFDKLLEDPLGVHALLEFLKKEHCEENILFWKDTQEFKQNAPQNKNLSTTVKRIYDEYLGPSSPKTVNIDDRALKSIESKLANPPLNIFGEACEQIYLLMKMDCYPRFKKSPLVKECLLAEMEGKPLPIDLPQGKQDQQQQSSQYAGIWKKHREFGFGRSLFGRFSRHSRVQHEQAPQVPSGVEIWGVTTEDKGRKQSVSGAPDSRRSKDEKRERHSNTSPRPRKSATVKESKSKRRSGGSTEPKAHSPHGSTDPGKHTPAEDFPPEDHLNVFQTHKTDVFEVNLPNKVTKIMAVPPEGTVSDAIKPVLTKHGYNLDIMELHFANNLKLIDLNSPASILIGQHIVVIKSKNTFIAAFPDVLERIMPADGSTTIGDLFVGVLKEMGKLQNFSVAVEGARVPLELSTDTSVLVGQRVVVKYLPGPLNSKYAGEEDDLQSKSKTSLNSSSSSTGRTEMDDLLSMIERLSSDKLSDQRISPSPLEPSDNQSSSEDLKKYSPGEMRNRSQSQGKRRSPGSSSTGSHHHNHSSHHHHRPLATSKSTDSIDVQRDQSQQQVSSRHYMSARDRHRRSKDNMLRPPGSVAGHKHLHMTRTHSGGALLSNNHTPMEGMMVQPRSLSPPANVSSGGIAQELRNRTISPPPPTSRPPPLPAHAKRQPISARWSGVSYKSTDSASSEDSLTTDLPPRYPRQHGGSNELLQQRNTGSKPEPQFFPRAHTPNSQNLSYNPQSHQDKLLKAFNTRPTSAPRNSNTGQQDPAQNAVKNAYNSSGTGGPLPPSSSAGNLTVAQHSRKTSWQGGKPMDHPLQMSVSRGHSQSIGSTLSSYPWHSAHSLPHQQHKQPTPQQKRASMPRTAAERRGLMENPQLLQAGDQIVQQEIEEYRRNSSSSDIGSPTSSEPRTPLSPTTHTLLADEADSQNHQRETFV